MVTQYSLYSLLPFLSGFNVKPFTTTEPIAIGPINTTQIKPTQPNLFIYLPFHYLSTDTSRSAHVYMYNLYVRICKATRYIHVHVPRHVHGCMRRLHVHVYRHCLSPASSVKAIQGLCNKMVPIRACA